MQKLLQRLGKVSTADGDVREDISVFSSIINLFLDAVMSSLPAAEKTLTHRYEDNQQLNSSRQKYSLLKILKISVDKTFSTKQPASQRCQQQLYKNRLIDLQ